MMHFEQWNWGGLAFVAAMFLFVALSGWATERLRRWAEEPKPPTPRDPELERAIFGRFTPELHDAELAAMRATAERPAVKP